MINWIAALQQLSSLQRMKEGGITTVRVGSERCSWRVAARFDDEEIEQLRQRCGELGMRWELVVNRPIEEEDLPWLDKLMSQLCLWRPDGIVFHDPAVLLSARQAGLDSELIFVSDTLMTNAWDVRRMREAGCDRVALSTEITLQEIMDIGSWGAGVRGIPAAVNQQLSSAARPDAYRSSSAAGFADCGTDAAGSDADPGRGGRDRGVCALDIEFAAADRLDRAGGFWSSVSGGDLWQRPGGAAGPCGDGGGAGGG